MNVPDESMIETAPECKSWVASRFSIVEEGGIYRRRCKFVDCNKEYSRGTSHMILKRHWARAHADIFSLSPRSRAMHAVTTGQNTTTTTAPTSTLKPPPMRKKKSPLKVSNSLSGGANQNINSPSGKLSSSSQNEKNQFDVKQVAKRLREAASIHLTFDIYTPKKGGKTFGIITAHSSSDSLDIRSVLLEYKHLPYPSDSNSLYEFLRSCISKFNCREKIISIVSNSSETVASAIQELNQRYRLTKNYNYSTVHIRCFPQIIHLNVIDVFKSQETLINGIRKIVGYINSNNFTMRPVATQDGDTQVEVVQRTNSVDGTFNTSATATQNNSIVETKPVSLKLPSDSNRSSWNATYIMIETFLSQRAFIEPAYVYFQDAQEFSDISVDWDRLYALVQLLKPFYEAMNKFATEDYAPVSLVAACIPHLLDHLSNTNWGYDDLDSAADKFKLQLDEYRQSFQSDLTIVAGLLDPRIKDTFTSPDRREDVINILKKRLGEPSPIKVDNVQQHAENSLWSRIFQPLNQDEVLDYLNSPREHGYTNVIAYWETHKHVYPALYSIARALVCVQATSVPNDRTFAAAENLKEERKLQTESTNSKELMRSWAKYLEK